MKEVNLKEFREIQLNILKAIDKYCNENELNYSLAFGTLIGAIRHKGYIPWDDDIDIMMPREDYEYLKNNFKSEEYELYSRQKYSNYNYPFIKVGDKSTLLVEDVEDKFDLGVNIDVFPIDGTNNFKYYIHRLLFRILTVKRINPSSNNRAISKRIILKSLKVISKLFSYDFIFKLMDILNNYESFEKSEKATYLYVEYNKPILDKSVFEEYINVEFEGEFYKSIKKYDTFLTNFYGDYMKLPPEDKRVTHHTFKVFKK